MAEKSRLEHNFSIQRIESEAISLGGERIIGRSERPALSMALFHSLEKKEN